MRLWSISFKYLDSKGLVALWRESLLAKNVLEGRTKGYKNHPQLERFKKTSDPVSYINKYLSTIYQEADLRGYHFNKTKFDEVEISEKIPVTKGQIEFEVDHLRNKLKIRDLDKYVVLDNVSEPEISSLFYQIDGGVEEWEKI